MQRQATFNFTVIYEQLSTGGYNVIVPAIPEIVTYGETLEEAREMASDAIRCFLESAIETGEPIPKEVTPAVEQLAVTI